MQARTTCEGPTGSPEPYLKRLGGFLHSALFGNRLIGTTCNVNSSVEKRTSSRRPQGPLSTPGQLSSDCLRSGTKNKHKLDLAMLDRLFESHAELCTTLRLVGREMLHVDKHNRQTLDKIRRVLKQAENVRRALRMPNESPYGIDELPEAAGTSFLESKPAGTTNEARRRTSLQKKSRLSRPRSLGVVEFPSG